MKPQELKRKYLDNPVLFIAHYLPQSEPLEQFHIDLIMAMHLNNRCIFWFPAAHGKTTLATLYIIYRISKNPNIRIKLICANADAAEAISLDIINHLTSNKKLVRDFGPFEPKDKKKVKWGARRFSVQKRTRRGKDDTLEAYGIGGFSPGPRADLVICDDLVDEENSFTIERRKKLLNRFDVIVTKTAEKTKDFEIKVIGTAYAWGDLYHTLIERVEKGIDRRWRWFRKDCFKDKACTQPIWPAKNSIEDLEAERLSDPISFDKRFRNLCYPEELLTFPSEKIDECVRAGAGRRRGEKGNFKIVIGFDPGTAETKKASYSALMVLGLNEEEKEKRYLIDVWRKRCPMDEQIDTLIEFYRRYEPHEIRIEANAYQRGLLRMLDREAQKQGLNIYTKPHQTQRNKLDPIMGVESLRAIITNHNLIIPPDCDDFVEELRRYPVGEHTDMVMALWFAELAIREGLKKYRVLKREVSPILQGIRQGFFKVYDPEEEERALEEAKKPQKRTMRQLLGVER